jgi:hypothetical protein
VPVYAAVDVIFTKAARLATSFASARECLPKQSRDYRLGPEDIDVLSIAGWWYVFCTQQNG